MAKIFVTIDKDTVVRKDHVSWMEKYAYREPQYTETFELAGMETVYGIKVGVKHKGDVSVTFETQEERNDEFRRIERELNE